MSKVNTNFSTDLKKYGSINFNECYNCGNCTAVCSLSTEESSFPREMVRYSILGLDKDIKSSLKPWLCYYCGECSETCPRVANPGELMMILRRWLITKYDWTGLSGVLFKSLTASIVAFALVAILVIIVGFFKQFNTEALLHLGHYFEMISIASVFLIILLPNIIRMWWFTIIKTKAKVNFLSYLKAIWDLIVHMFTQKRSLECEEENTFRWLEHFLIVIGYLLLLFITVFLDWFATESKIVLWSGYIVSALVFIITFDFVLDRIKKNKEINKFSHPSDWFFVIWLFLMAFSAFVVRVFIDAHLIDNNIWVYMVHIIILAQWAMLIVPFGKWTHFLYRSFAMYFDKLKMSQ